MKFDINLFEFGKRVRVNVGGKNLHLTWWPKIREEILWIAELLRLDAEECSIVEERFSDSGKLVTVAL